jgi:DNA-binding IclR family transcriptional regulator
VNQKKINELLPHIKNNNLLEQIYRIINNIRDYSDLATSFFLEEGNNCICIYRAHSNIEIIDDNEVKQGDRLSLNRCASGHVILSHGKQRNDKEGFYKDIKDQGYCLLKGYEHSSLAYPVMSSCGKFVGSICVFGTKESFMFFQKDYILNLIDSQLQIEGFVSEKRRLISANSLDSHANIVNYTALE